MLGVNECKQYLRRLSGTPNMRTSSSQFRCVTTRKTRHEHVSTASCPFELCLQLRRIMSTSVVLFSSVRAGLKAYPFMCPHNAIWCGMAGEEWHTVSHARPDHTGRLMTSAMRYVCCQPGINFCGRNALLMRIVVGSDKICGTVQQ